MELGDGDYSVVFDSTPYRCQCFGIGVRFVTDGQVVFMGVNACCSLFYGRKTWDMWPVAVRTLALCCFVDRGVTTAPSSDSVHFPSTCSMVPSCFERCTGYIPCEKVVQRHLRLSMLKSSMNFRDITGQIAKVLMGDCGVVLESCIGSRYDGCSTNHKAVDVLQGLCPNAVGVLCCSHLLNNTGKQFGSEDLGTFMSKLFLTMAHSTNARDY